MRNSDTPTTYRLGRWVVHEDWPLWAVLLGAAVVAAVLLPTLPERVPVHWDVHGDVNGWGSRGFATFGQLGVVAAVYGLMLVVPLVDPRRTAYPSFAPTYRVVRWALVTCLLGVWGVALAAARGAEVRVESAVPVIVSVLFMVLGNVMGRLRHNWFVGIRTPWSLSSEEAWRLTHRAAAPAWVLGGAVSLVGGLAGGPAALWAMGVGVGGAVVFSVVYSYVAYRRVAARTEPPAGPGPA